MLQRDYIQRLIREFFAALERMLEKKEISDRREQLQKMYDQYVGPYSFYFTAELDDIMQSIADMPEQDRPYKAQMLAELYVAEAEMISIVDAERLLRNACVLYDYVEKQSKTYDPELQARVKTIQDKLKKI